MAYYQLRQPVIAWQIREMILLDPDQIILKPRGSGIGVTEKIVPYSWVKDNQVSGEGYLIIDVEDPEIYSYVSADEFYRKYVQVN